jgi:hypothetical protein
MGWKELNCFWFFLFTAGTGQHFHARNALLILLLGSFAVSAEVFFFLCPFIRAQKESRREPPSGCGGFNPGLPGFAAL